MGNLFAVVTGRDYAGSFELFKSEQQLPFDFVIASNGAIAYDKDGNIHFAEKIRREKSSGEKRVVQELVMQILKLTSKPCGISFEKGRYDFHPEYPQGARVGNVNYSAFSVLENVVEFVSSNAVCGSVDHSREVVRKLREEFGAYVNPMQNNACIDITALGVDKATGIARLADNLGIDRENIWTVGDNFNDIPMNKNFHGCAMAYGVDDLKKVSEYVCESVAEVIEIILSK